MRVIGTAGHVDHGKSTLIAALTGTHPDRLKEEQEREMTIDLGFGWLTLPNGEEVGIVDVPGHRDFIENMLAGIGGIDAALLIIAADEGIMPQTREHLAILDLLQIQNGIIVITKTDLIQDEDWMMLLETEIRSAVKGTVLENAPALRISARSGIGLRELLSTLESVLQNAPARVDFARPRLPIDRVFSMAGFGTVITGTLSDGKLIVGDEVVVLPSGKTGRIRGLQTHKQKEETAIPGSRTAVNISGIAVEDIARGEVLTTPGHYLPTRRVDAHFKLLKDASLPMKHADEVKFFSGTSEVIATVRLLDKEVLNPSQTAWVQLELREPVVLMRGDKYILRRPSPSETLGGGKIIDEQPNYRHKRFDERVIKQLESLLNGSPAQVLIQSILSLGAVTKNELIVHSKLDATFAKNELKKMIIEKTVIELDGNFILHASFFTNLQSQISGLVSEYHHQYPLRRGMGREELKSKVKMNTKIFNALIKKLVEENILAETNTQVALPKHEIKFSADQNKKIEAVIKAFSAAPFTPPSVKDAQSALGEDVYNALVDLETFIEVSDDVLFRKQDYDLMVANITEYIRQKGQINVAEARDLFNTSRKYALGLMEHLDKTGVTVRDGDFRKLK